MEPTSLTPPSHDSPPSSGRLTPPARNSMEDEDASVKRKRPRLDSGQRAHHQLGAEYTSPGEQSSDCTTAEGQISMSYDGNRSGSPLSSDPQPGLALSEGEQPAVGTPSKVTLNLRDPNRSISPSKQIQEAPVPFHDLRTTPPAVHKADLVPSVPSPATLTGDETAQGPVEIEVAEPEDIDGPPDATVWHAASHFDWRQWHEDSLARFPVAGDSGLPWSDAFVKFWHSIIAGPTSMAKLLKDTNEWLASYLDESEGVPHRWAELIAIDPMFWRQLNRLYRSVCREEFMSVLDQCLASSSFDNSIFIDFLCRVISVTKRLMRVDQISLEAANAQKAPEVLLLAPDYVHSATTIICNKRVTTVLKNFGYDDLLDGPIDRLRQEIHLEPSFLKICAACVSVTLTQNRPDSSSQELLTSIFKSVQEFCTTWADDVDDDTPSNTSLASRYFDFYESATEKMQFAIKKQFPMVNVDLLATFVNAITIVVQHTALADTGLIDRLFDGENRDAAAALSKYDRAWFANVAWRLKFLERSIREGRMEIRIHALETLSKILIEVFREYIQNANDTDHVIVQWTSTTLRESKIIDYLLSVDSHPQLVMRSNYVIGFLAASHTYSPEQTDMIWTYVQTSEDPRMFEQIVSALGTTFNLLDLEPLLYFCSKFSDLSASTFDHRYRNLFILLLSQLQKKWAHQEVIDLRPYIVLLRLLRQIGKDSSLPNLRRIEIWKFAQDATKRLLVQKWDLEQRLEVYQHCLNDFSAEDGAANGTCLVMNRFFEFYGQPDLTALSHRNDLVSTIISEFNHLKSIQVSSQVNLEEFSEPVKERLRIIEKILLHLPETITAELGKPLWASMVGENAIGRQARNDAWESLALVASHSSEANPFLDLGVVDYLPTLDPSLHTRSLLAFAHHLWDYQGRAALQSLSDAQESTVEARDSLFWQLALSTEDDFLASGAIKALVERVVYESKNIARDGLTKSQADFVQRAVTQLIDAAVERRKLIEEASVEAVLTEQELIASSPIASSTIRFQRAFVMLKQLGQNLKALEPNAPSERSDSQTSRHSINGQKVEIKYQTSDRGIPSQIKLLEIGDQSTVSELIEIFKAKTGFSKFNLIAGGQRINQEEDGPRTVASCGLSDKGALILHKIPGSESTKPAGTTQKLKPLEREIMKYFPQLYELLSVDSRLSQSVLDFSTTFPPHETIIKLVTTSSHGPGDIFPLAEPCKLLYSLHAMKFALQRQLEEGLIRDDFMAHCVTTLVKTLLSIDLSSESTIPSNNLVALHLVLVLLMFLKEPVSATVSEKYFEAPPAFVDKIIELSRTVQTDQLYEVHQSSFAVLLEAARLSSGVWGCFTKNPATMDLFRLLLLCNPKVEGRLSAQRTVLSILSTISTSENEIHEEIEQKKVEKDVPEKPSQVSAFLTFTWTTMVSLFPDAARYPANSAQFFDLAVDIFKKLSNYSVEAAQLQEYLHSWLALLLQYRHNEIIGQDSTDRFVKGVCELINQCLALLNKANDPPVVDDSVFSQLFNQFLFPPINSPAERQSIKAFGPILSSETRASLYMMVVWLSVNNERLRTCTEFVYQALLEVSDPSSVWAYERQKNVRSAAGYPGLTNLSNTCYLNSLTTQLFMNPRFRDFILRLELIDSSSQKLLFALRQLFADVQDGWVKSVNTQDLADAIETYEGPLDPAIQMDVDEAFNLIFDRIESQLLNSNDKQKFKTLFGGQIVQQIKSKECDHISERLEPVTAVQCDIQGKTSLEDSLKAYIEGEVMEGDNKYKCSTCDRYVNAVKRACLRDVPNNLIFHLKRFDYDLLQGTRNKLNDFFSFPERVDMTPYTDKYLQDPSGPSKPDMFLLTGVLVHSGTAELGHYYSFIRERPVSLQSWVEFNDADVSRYDARNMQEHCFGGDYRDQYTGAAYPRMYNAYMLFYQRETSIEPEDKHFGGPASPMCQPARAEIPRELSLDLATRNEVLARTYCFFDPTHAKFLRDLYVRRNHLQGTHSCSDDHVLEETYLHCLWQHVLYVFGRDISKQCCADILGTITEMMSNCLQCCSISIEWLVGPDEIRLRLLLLRLPDPVIRQRIGSLLCDGMMKLRNQDPEAYGSTEVDSEMEMEEEAAPIKGMFMLVMARLRAVQRLLPYHMRAWVDFYDLLRKFVAFGPSERIYMHQTGFLQHAIETLLIDNDHDWSSVFPEGQHQIYIKTLEKRQFNLAGLVRFIGVLLPPMIAAHGSESNGDISTDSDVGLLSRAQIEFIEWPLNISDNGRRIPWFLDRFACSDDGTVSNYEPLEAVVRAMVRAVPALKITQTFENLVQLGLEKNPAWLAEPYLHAALAFMDSSSDAVYVEKVLKNIVSSVPSIGNTGGDEHLNFFRKALHIRNADAFPERPEQVKLMTIQMSGQWAPTLLFYSKDNIAFETRRLLEDLFKQNLHGNEEDEEFEDMRQSAFDHLYSRVVGELNRLLSNGQAIGEYCTEALRFCESFLPNSFLREAEEDRVNRRARVRDLISRIQNFLVLSDDGSPMNGDSDELTDVSSTYEAPST